jgi:hypothetical protein
MKYDSARSRDTILVEQFLSLIHLLEYRLFNSDFIHAPK